MFFAIRKNLQKLFLVVGMTLVFCAVFGWAVPSASSASTVVVQRVAAVECSSDACRNLYTKYINPLVRLLSAAVGVVVVASIVIGGVQYSAAGSDPQKVAEARKRISNAILALVVFIFLSAFLQWLIPGGIY
ncbi:MAG: hypothetical protein WBP26_05645 [Candidatus Saccharimonadales bacterium]